MALTLYTLAITGLINSYHVILSILSALFASINGFRVVTTWSSTFLLSGGDWPAVCASRPPQGMCAQGLDLKYDFYPDRWFIAGATLCDLTVLIIAGWYLLAHVVDPPWLGRFRERLERSNSLYTWMNACLHSGACIILIGYTAVILFYFARLFQQNSIMDLHNWSFGQIVGITIWTAIIVDLARHKLGMFNTIFVICGLNLLLPWVCECHLFLKPSDCMPPSLALLYRTRTRQQYQDTHEKENNGMVYDSHIDQVTAAQSTQKFASLAGLKPASEGSTMRRTMYNAKTF